jgi:hypothetical protein
VIETRWIRVGPSAREHNEASTPPGVAERPAIDGHSRGGQFICDILIKSYPRDYERLRYCLRSMS